MRKLRERTQYPAADGWVIIENQLPHPLDVSMEVWGVGGTIPVGGKAHVLIKPDRDEPVTFIVHNSSLQIYCADAIYSECKEILDMSDE